MALVAVEEHDEGVTLVRLTDPDRRNAMGEEMAAELRAAVAGLAGDVRVLVVTGDGGSFCAGADLPALFGDARERPTTEIHARLSGYYRAFLDIRDLGIPTIAAVAGPAVGAGLNLALACDIRIAGRDASFGATFAKIGLHPGGGCTAFLVEAMGPSRALRTLLLGDPLDAEAAVAERLADGPVDDPLAHALDLAGRFAKVDAGLARQIKATVRQAADLDVDGVLAVESWAQAASASSDRLAEWVGRFSR